MSYYTTEDIMKMDKDMLSVSNARIEDITDEDIDGYIDTANYTSTYSYVPPSNKYDSKPATSTALVPYKPKNIFASIWETVTSPFTGTKKKVTKKVNRNVKTNASMRGSLNKLIKKRNGISKRTASWVWKNGHTIPRPLPASLEKIFNDVKEMQDQVKALKKTMLPGDKPELDKMFKPYTLTAVRASIRKGKFPKPYNSKQFAPCKGTRAKSAAPKSVCPCPKKRRSKSTKKKVVRSKTVPKKRKTTKRKPKSAAPKSVCPKAAPKKRTVKRTVKKAAPKKRKTTKRKPKSICSKKTVRKTTKRKPKRKTC